MMETTPGARKRSRSLKKEMRNELADIEAQQQERSISHGGKRQKRDGHAILVKTLKKQGETT